MHIFSASIVDDGDALVHPAVIYPAVYLHPAFVLPLLNGIRTIEVIVRKGFGWLDGDSESHVPKLPKVRTL